MRMTEISKGSVGLVGRTTLLLVAGLLLLPGAARAADVTVDCDNFESLQAAINGLDPAGPNTITVTGTCQERVHIGDAIGVGYQGLVIQGPEAGTAAITPPPAGQGFGNVMLICGSHAIFLQRLVLRGGNRGLVVCDQAEVDTDLLTIEDNVSSGALVAGTSILFLSGATIRNNGQFGVITSGSQPATVFLGRGFDGTTPTVVEGHSIVGVSLSFAASGTLAGPVQVRNNGDASNPDSAGIRIARNSALRVLDNRFGNPEISGNAGPGILARVGSSVTVAGATIANNTGAGIRVESLSVAEIEASNSFFANGAFALSCDVSSWAVGDLTGVVPLDCKNFEIKPSKDKDKSGAAASAEKLGKPPK